MANDRDKNGFIVLKRVSADTKAPTYKKARKNPFKKGSWKAWLYKKLKKWKSSKYVADFHYMHATNAIIQSKNKTKTVIMSTRPDDDMVDKLKSKKYRDAMVMIDCGEGVYLRISSKCYCKLMEIDRIAINVSLKAQEDGEDDFFDVFDEDKVYDNINTLLSWVNYYRQLVNGIGEIQCRCCWFTYVKYNCKTVVQKRDGSIETYKGDFNEFLTAYDFDPLL